MTRTAPIVKWNDPQDPVVLQGLALKCGACGAPAGEWCVNTVNGRPLSELKRWIHHYRLDKAFKADKEES